MLSSCLGVTSRSVRSAWPSSRSESTGALVVTVPPAFFRQAHERIRDGLRPALRNGPAHGVRGNSQHQPKGSGDVATPGAEMNARPSLQREREPGLP